MEKKFTAGTKYLLDFMFYAGSVVTVTLPFSVKWVGTYLEGVAQHEKEIIVIYFVLGIAALAIIRELRKIFATVLKEDCFTEQNVESLKRMSMLSFFIVLMSIVRSIVYLTVAMLVVILVFLIAGLFSRVLAAVFAQAVKYKQENDFTI